MTDRKTDRKMNPRLARSVLLAFLLGASSACDLLGVAPCDADENCPSTLVCQSGLCGVALDAPPAQELPVATEERPVKTPAPAEQQPSGDEGEDAEVPCNFIYGSVEIDSDEKASSLRELTCLAVIGDVRFSGGITSLSGLEGLRLVDGDLIVENSLLTSLEGLDHLSQVNGSLLVRNNAELLRFGKGLALLSSVLGDVQVDDNVQLSFCAVRALVVGLDAVGGAVSARNNAPGQCAG
jgi:hypothetical protein